MFAHSTQTIPLPDNVCTDALKAHIVNQLQADHTVESNSIELEDDTIYATRNPSIRSRTETITVHISNTELTITAESPEQIFDWLRSAQTTRSLARSVRQSLAAE